MKKFFVKRKRPLLFFALIIFLVPNFFSTHLMPLSDRGYRWEKFDPKLAYNLTSIATLIKYTDSLAMSKNIDGKTLAYGNLLVGVIKNRFYHGYSHYSTQENWIASVAGKFAWSHLSAIVIPDDLMKYKMAACSQQTIILMACFKRKGIPYRKVGFDHHFAAEGNFNRQWYYFDPNMEPDFSSISRSSISSLINKRQLNTVYKKHVEMSTLQSGFSNLFYGSPNVEPAYRATLFHSFTKVLSRFLWLMPMLALVIPACRKIYIFKIVQRALSISISKTAKHIFLWRREPELNCAQKISLVE